MSETTTIRVSKEVYENIKVLAQQEKQKMQDVVAAAIRDYREKKFFTELNNAYARLKADPEARMEEEAERLEWDITLLDGLEDEDAGK